jgi:hypothetical protein
MIVGRAEWEHDALAFFDLRLAPWLMPGGGMNAGPAWSCDPHMIASEALGLQIVAGAPVAIQL